MSNIHFHGQGVQNSGSGGVIVGRDLKIGSSKNDCLIDLYVTDPRHDKKRIEEAKGGLLAESYVWVLRQDDFLRWRHGTAGRLLWIRGDPGKGKTMLLCGIIDELEKDNKGGDDDSRLLSFFFCQTTDTRLNTAMAVLRGLIYRLVNQQPPLLRHVQERYEQKGKQLFEDENAWVALSEIFEEVIKDPSLPGATFVIDGLDECEKNLSQLIRLIIKLSSNSSKVKWIVSSRNWMELDEQLKPAAQLSLESNASSISNAVLIYIRHEVERLANLKGYSNELRSEVREYLSSNANGTFLWVALACKSLANPRVRIRHTRTVLHKFPPGLNALYDRMMGQIVQSDDADICKRTLAVMALTYQPPRLLELIPLVDSGGDLTDCLEEIIQLCGSFLIIRDGTVFFIHQSAKDYILENAMSTIFPSGIANEHHAIFQKSLNIMSQTLRRNIYHLEDWAASSHELVRPDPDPLAAVRYACIHWGQHMDDSQLVSQTQCDVDLLDGGIIDTFIRKHYLHWLEALSLLGGVIKGLQAMEKINRMLEGKTTHIYDLVRDAYQFLRHNQEAISESPLQTYASALFFSPHRSIIRRLFQKEIPQWLSLEPAIEDDWPDSKFDHRTIVNMIFSPAGRYLAAFSSNGTAKIWDAENGEWIDNFRYDYWNNSTVFSSDGNMIASISPAYTIYIWDTLTKMWLKIFTTHQNYVHSIAFSPNGNRIASGSEDHTIKIWDTTTGAYLTTFVGHSDTVAKIAFSLDGGRLASASNDHMIKIWDLATGTCITTFVIHYGGDVKSMAFSPDGSRLATGLSYVAQIWDPTTGVCLATLERHSSWVTLVAFSPDGSQVATVADNHAARVWDVATGTRLAVLRGHWGCRGRIETMAFSSDGRCLVTNTGTLPLPKSLHNSTSSNFPSQNHHDFELSDTWLTFNGQKLLWIPFDYRTCFSVTERTIAIGCRSGQVWFFSSNGEIGRKSRVHLFNGFDNEEFVI
ncbi:quinon protein alcohol dehydrogenase-like superfamily [Annulohypoxylon nitens]|nr:quinon protein alcohol dehydrogenase-like superfamily [Annulohypoxylon nitens]